MPYQPSQNSVQRSAALGALALGGFGIGVTEFASMGLLPDIARDLLPGFELSPESSIAHAGILISAYALGVVVGAPILASVAAKMSQTKLAFVLLIAFVGGTLASAFAPTFETLAVARFVAGLPHGAYFGVASLLAARIMGPGSQGKGVALALSGLTIANVIGVPLATWIGQELGWRAAYVLVAVIFALTLALGYSFLPRFPGDPTRSAKAELRAFASGRLWIMIGVGAIGFGGFFAVYSYIAEAATRVAGLAPEHLPWVLAVMGAGMTIGNIAGGWATDRHIGTTMCVGFGGFILSLLLYTWLAATVPGLFVTVFLIGFFDAMLIPSIQARLIRIAGKAALLGAAMNHAAFNMGNALGAWLGGAVIAAGFGYLAPGWVGVVLGALGFALVGLSMLVEPRDRPQEPTADSR